MAIDLASIRAGRNQWTRGSEAVYAGRMGAIVCVDDIDKNRTDVSMNTIARHVTKGVLAWGPGSLAIDLHSERNSYPPISHSSSECHFMLKAGFPSSPSTANT